MPKQAMMSMSTRRSGASAYNRRPFSITIGAWILLMLCGCIDEQSTPRVSENAESRHPVVSEQGIQPASKPDIRESAQSLKELWRIEGLGAPAGLAFDGSVQELRLTQIGGDGNTKDGDGVVSRISLEGAMLEYSWISGLDAPKDLLIDRDSLWITDIDSVYEFDRQTGESKHRYEASAGSFLVGMALTEGNGLLVADLLGSRILRLNQDRMEVVQDGPELQSPSRLAARDADFFIAPWGYTTDFTSDEQGLLSLWNSEEKTLRKLDIPMSGHWMGLCEDGDNGWFLGDFATGTILHLLKDGECERLTVLGRGLCAIHYLPDRKLLLVAHVTENRLIAFQITQSIAMHVTLGLQKL